MIAYVVYQKHTRQLSLSLFLSLKHSFLLMLALSLKISLPLFWLCPCDMTLILTFFLKKSSLRYLVKFLSRFQNHLKVINGYLQLVESQFSHKVKAIHLPFNRGCFQSSKSCALKKPIKLMIS